MHKIGIAPRFWLVVMLALALVTSLVFSLSASAGVPPYTVWSPKEDMPTGLYRLGVAAVDLDGGRIYTIGGQTTGTGDPVPTVEEYNIATNAWNPIPPTPMPTARSRMGVTTAKNGNVYVIGGNSPDDVTTIDTVEEYNPATNSWSPLKPMNEGPRHVLGAVTGSDKKIYAIGGVAGSNQSALGTVEAYDFETKNWTTRKSMNIARWGMSVVATDDGKIYAIGWDIDSGLTDVV